MAERKFDEKGYPTDPWARRIRVRFEEGTQPGDKSNAANQQAQMEAIAAKMDQGMTFAQAVGREEQAEAMPVAQTGGSDGVIDTRADVMAVRDQLKMELAKPADQRNMEFIRRGTSIITAFADQSNVEVPDGAEVAFTGTSVPPKRMMTRDGPVDVPPQQQLAQRAMAMEAKNRGQDIVNFLRRPFLSDQEKAKEAEELRIQRAEEKIQLDADAQQSGVDPASLKPAEVTGGLIPDILGGAIGGVGFARTGAGALGRIATEAGIGAILGGSNTPLDEDPTNAALIDGGITFGLGTMTEIPGLAYDFLRREIRAARNSNQDANLQGISEATGIDLTIGERTQNPAALVAERNVPGRPEGPRAQFLQQRKQQLNDNFNRIEGTLNPEAMTPAEVVRGTAEAYDQHITAMAKLSSQQFRNTMEEVLPGVRAHMDSEGRIVGGFKFVQPRELINELQVQRRLLADQPLSDANRFALRDLDAEIAKLKKNGLDLGQVQRLLSDLSGRNAPTGIVIKDNTQASEILNSKSVQRAINRDLDSVIQSGTMPEEMVNAVTTLQDARRQFAIERADIDVFKNTQVDKLLGKVGDPTSADFAQKVLKLDANEFNTLLRIADDADPRLGNAIRGVSFKELVDKHTKFGVIGSNKARTAVDIDVKGLTSEFQRMPISAFQAFTGTNLPVEQAQYMRNTMVALQAISEGAGTSTSARSLRERMEQWAINAASRDAGFMSRLLAGELSPGVFERMLFTKQGQQALSNASNPKVLAPQLAQAFTYFSNVMAEDEKAREELKRQQIMRDVNNPDRFKAL